MKRYTKLRRHSSYVSKRLIFYLYLLERKTFRSSATKPNRFLVKYYTSSSGVGLSGRSIPELAPRFSSRTTVPPFVLSLSAVPKSDGDSGSDRSLCLCCRKGLLSRVGDSVGRHFRSPALSPLFYSESLLVYQNFDTHKRTWCGYGSLSPSFYITGVSPRTPVRI